MLPRFAGILGAVGLLLALTAPWSDAAVTTGAAASTAAAATSQLAPTLTRLPATPLSPRSRCSGDGSFEEPYEALEPQMAMSADGHVVVTWARQAPPGWVVEMVSAAPGAPWTTPVAVATVPRDPADDLSACSVSVAMGARDEAVAAWTINRDTETAVVQLASRDAGSAWSAPQTITAPGEVYGAQVAMNRAGYAVATWWRDGAGALRAEVSTRATGQAWSAPREVASAPNTIDIPATAVAIGAAGEIAILWARDNTDGMVVQAVTRSGAGAWSEPVALDRVRGDGFFNDLGLVVGAGGGATAVWLRSPDMFEPGVVRAAREDPARGWSAAATVSGPHAVVDDGTLGLAKPAAGPPTIVWDGRSPACRRCHAMHTQTLGAGGRWSRAQLLLPGRAWRQERVSEWAMNDRGDLVVAYARERHTRGRRRFATFAQVRAASGQWSAPVRMAPAAADTVTIGPANIALTYLSPTDPDAVNETVTAVTGLWR